MDPVIHLHYYDVSKSTQEDLSGSGLCGYRAAEAGELAERTSLTSRHLPSTFDVCLVRQPTL